MAIRREDIEIYFKYISSYGGLKEFEVRILKCSRSDKRHGAKTLFRACR